MRRVEKKRHDRHWIDIFSSLCDDYVAREEGFSHFHPIWGPGTLFTSGMRTNYATASGRCGDFFLWLEHSIRNGTNDASIKPQLDEPHTNSVILHTSSHQMHTYSRHKDPGSTAGSPLCILGVHTGSLVAPFGKNSGVVPGFFQHHPLAKGLH